MRQSNSPIKQRYNQDKVRNISQTNTSIQYQIIHNKHTIQKNTIIQKNVNQMNFEQYEKQIKIMKGSIIMAQWQLMREKKKRSFEALKYYSIRQTSYKDSIQLPFQQFKINEDTILNIPKEIGVELIEKIQENIDLEDQQEKEFLNTLNAIGDSIRDMENQSCLKFTYIVQRKIISKMNQGFKAINQENNKILNANKRQKNLQNLIKHIVLPFSQLVNLQMKLGFNRIFLNSQPHSPDQSKDSINEQIDVRGKALLRLGRFVNQNMRRAMWNWRLSSTTKGKDLLKKAADNLVLFTNVNKTSAFYRLFELIKSDRCPVPIRFRNGITIFSIFLNNKINQQRRECFLRIKFFFGNNGLQNLTKKFLQSEKQLLLKKCKYVFNMFMILEKDVKKNTDHIFFSKIQKDRILWTFRQMVQNLKGNQRDVLKIWRDLTSQTILKQNIHSSSFDILENDENQYPSFQQIKLNCNTLEINKQTLNGTFEQNFLKKVSNDQ